MSLNAGTPTRVLVQCLARAGFGYLAGPESRALRVILRTLSDMMTARDASCIATANQVADQAGYSERWTRFALGRLEEAGIIWWKRGGIVDGKPQPSTFTIVRAVLVILIDDARVFHDQVIEKRRERTAARIAGLKRLYVRSKSQKRRSVHAEVTSSLPPTGTTYRAETAPGSDPPTTPAARIAGLQACRAALRA